MQEVKMVRPPKEDKGTVAKKVGHFLPDYVKEGNVFWLNVSIAMTFYRLNGFTYFEM